MSAWLTTHVEQAGELDYEPALNWYGLTLKPKEAPDEDADSEADSGNIWLGTELDSGHANPILSRVRSDGPGAAAGLNVGDELIAINGLRCSKGGLEDLLKQYKNGETLALLISRRGRLMTLEMQATEKPADEWKLRTADEASEQRESHLNSLLNLY